MRILLQNSSSDRKLYHGINLYVVEYLGDVVVGVLTYYFLQIANAVGIYNGLAMELGAHFEAYSNALLRNHTAEAQTQIRTEGITADVAMDIEVIVQLHVIISQSHADQVKDFLLVSWILVGESLNLVTMTAQFGDFRIAE